MKTTLHFHKYHGLGNDFILIDAISQRVNIDNASELAIKLCDRHFGVGADGIILACESKDSDISMRVFNSDGSEPEMCGNGLRCFARFVYDHHLVEKDIFSVETIGGIKIPAIIKEKGEVVAIEVDMGEPILEPENIPVLSKNNPVIKEPLSVNNQIFEYTAVSMGNPHAVVFVDDLIQIDLDTLGPLFEKHKNFPKGINTEFTQILNKKEAVMVVWERGSGETMACGTGACAIVVAGVLNNLLDRKSLIHLPGGDLKIEWQKSDNHVIMTGPAEHVFSGELEV